MGLDMYLSVTRYLSKYSKDKELKLRLKVLKLFPEPKPVNLESVEVKIQVGYWRKANQIHKWFVENVQNGVDNCANYYVGRDKLTKLKEQCEEALKSKDYKGKMPTREGFFFGGTEYDEWYIEDLKYTVELIEGLLELPEDYSFEYNSSW